MDTEKLFYPREPIWHPIVLIKYAYCDISSTATKAHLFTTGAPFTNMN